MMTRNSPLGSSGREQNLWLITAGHPGPKADSLIAVLATNSGTTTYQV